MPQSREEMISSSKYRWSHANAEETAEQYSTVFPAGTCTSNNTYHATVVKKMATGKKMS